MMGWSSTIRTLAAPHWVLDDFRSMVRTVRNWIADDNRGAPQGIAVDGARTTQQARTVTQVVKSLSRCAFHLCQVNPHPVVADRKSLHARFELQVDPDVLAMT